MYFLIHICNTNDNGPESYAPPCIYCWQPPQRSGCERPPHVENSTTPINPKQSLMHVFGILPEKREGEMDIQMLKKPLSVIQRFSSRGDRTMIYMITLLQSGKEPGAPLAKRRTERRRHPQVARQVPPRRILRWQSTRGGRHHR